MILNNKKNVSFADETIEKVLRAAQQLNYIAAFPDLRHLQSSQKNSLPSLPPR
jgi:DNA-binding LacI/PurR family transcriptional regulator